MNSIIKIILFYFQTLQFFSFSLVSCPFVFLFYTFGTLSYHLHESSELHLSL